jgi:hypothetical protein
MCIMVIYLWWNVATRQGIVPKWIVRVHLVRDARRAEIANL